MKVLANITVDRKLQMVVIFGSEERSIGWILQDLMRLW
jgi:hypothetical protein